ncbi:MAG: Gfo/Idh/MocA family oxidoreductase [Firmicutes bacterium]|nr:Gfo/Idh/MocA family oxidoreductase [Bacillota bacterium]
MSRVTIAVVGAGNRGQAYGRFVTQHPAEAKIVAVAEPHPVRRQKYAEQHQIPEDNQFASWEELLARPRLADGLIIATLDDQHVEPAVAAMEKGYTVLLEKPIAHTWEGTLQIAQKAKDTGARVLVAHVLRYTNFYRQLKRLLDSRVIGEPRLVDHLENIGYWHFAHSYVRGNWRNTAAAAPIILAKTCHDLDLLYWLFAAQGQTIFSNASLVHFTAQAKPAGAGERCLDCRIEPQCPYSARKVYINENSGWPVSVITEDLSFTGRYQALQEGPYGRCVYSCDNNVPDVQTVSLRLKENLEVNMALTAFSSQINRITRIYGTHGELSANFHAGIIEIHRFGETKQVITVQQDAGGHGGGDFGLMRDFVRLLRGEELEDALTYLEDSLESHIMAFAAEQSRQEQRMIDLDAWKRDHGAER